MAVIEQPDERTETALAAWWRHFRYVVSENPVTLFAFCLFGMFVFLAFFGPWIVPFDPLASDTSSAGVSDGLGWKVSTRQRIQEFHDVPLRQKAQFVQG